MLSDTRPPLLEMTGISKAFAGVKALDDVSLAVRRGEIHALVGENGAGKSTLMKILAGAYRSDAGRIVLNGVAIDTPTPARMLELGIAVIYQELTQAPHLTVAENIFLNRLPRTRLGTIAWRRLQADARAVMGRLGFEVDPGAIIGALSVAQRQMVEIARAISLEAQLIILDEPSAVLGERELERLFATIGALSREGVSFIYISHRLNEVFEVCQNVTVLRDGRVAGSSPTARLTSDELIAMMVGRPMGDHFPPRHPRLGDVALAARGLRRGRAVDDVSLSVRAGEIVGICGLAGAGRSEVLRAIIGADRLDAGTIELRGAARHIGSPRQAIAAGIGFVPEDRKTGGLFLEQSVAFNISIARFADFLDGPRINLARELQAVAAHARRLRIKAPDMHARVSGLSGGNQQKCVLARQLNAGCDVLLIDEPTRGVDVGARREIYDVLIELTEQHGLAVLMVSSDLPEILGMSDRILVMREGRIAAEFARHEATEEKLMTYATTH